MTQDEILKIKAIDVHSHFGEEMAGSPESVIEDGSVGHLLRSMELSRIEKSFNSHRLAFGPGGKDLCVSANEKLIEAIEGLPGVYGWLVVNPMDSVSLKQARELLSMPKIIGIKIHPLAHGYDLLEMGESVFELAEEYKAPVLGHAGELPNSPEKYAEMANRHSSIPVIAAHLGNSYDSDISHYFKAIESCTKGNLYTDTSSSMSVFAGIIEYAVSNIGSDHILFGTDSSYYFSPAQRARIDYADISSEAKYNILRGNAYKLFND